jgi:hypothetical protein
MEDRKKAMVLCYGKNEHIPILLGHSHGLKQCNLAFYDCSTIDKSDEYLTLKRTAIINNKHISIIFTLSYLTGKEEFLGGHIYVNEKEYPISIIFTYESLQIENACYGNISVVKINDESFAI